MFHDVDLDDPKGMQNALAIKGAFARLSLEHPKAVEAGRDLLQRKKHVAFRANTQEEVCAAVAYVDDVAPVEGDKGCEGLWLAGNVHKHFPQARIVIEVAYPGLDTALKEGEFPELTGASPKTLEMVQGAKYFAHGTDLQRAIEEILPRQAETKMTVRSWVNRCLSLITPGR